MLFRALRAVRLTTKTVFHSILPPILHSYLLWPCFCRGREKKPLPTRLLTLVRRDVRPCKPMRRGANAEAEWPIISSLAAVEKMKRRHVQKRQ